MVKLSIWNYKCFKIQINYFLGSIFEGPLSISGVDMKWVQSSKMNVLSYYFLYSLVIKYKEINSEGLKSYSLIQQIWTASELFHSTTSRQLLQSLRCDLRYTAQLGIHVTWYNSLQLGLKTLFNIVEAPFEKLLNFDVCAVWWCSDGPINSQEDLKFMRSLSRYLWLNVTAE